MPLILLTGLPSSGKSTVAEVLSRFFNNQCGKSVEVISDDQHSTFSKQIYKDAAKEKEHRSWLRSQVVRLLNKDCIVIVDSLNYIKGYRYELYCMAKSAKTSYCVVLCDASPETASAFNASRSALERYDDDVLTALFQRFEAPQSSNRWDSPLFHVLKTPSNEEGGIPVEEISAAILDGKTLKPNLSTQSQPLASTNYLFTLDQLTQQMIQEIFAAQKSVGLVGGTVNLSQTQKPVTLNKHWTMPELARLRRQFITYTKLHPSENVQDIVNIFVDFINNSPV